MNPTVRSTLHTAIPALEAARVDTPRLDAELLLAHILGADRLALFAHPERPLTADEAQRFEAAVHRRLRREPLPYITGTREFLGLTFRVTPAVLIPRPETEVLVETVAACLSDQCDRVLEMGTVRPQASPKSGPHPLAPSPDFRGGGTGKVARLSSPSPRIGGGGQGVGAGLRLLDVGTGSGCIAIGLAHLLPRATVVAVEPSAAALAVARENAASLGVADRLEWIYAPFPEAVADRSGEFDAVVSNPPYIPEGELATLQPEVRDWEPREALVGGPDGLDLIRALARHAPRLLRPAGSGSAPGLLALEMALGEAARVVALLRATSQYTEIETVADLAGILRVCLARVQRP